MRNSNFLHIFDYVHDNINTLTLNYMPLHTLHEAYRNLRKLNLE